VRETSARSLGSALLIPCLLALLAAGCRTAPPEGLVRGAPLPLDDPRANRVVDAYLESAAARTALRGRAQVALAGPDFKLNRPQNVVVARPARLRFEVIGLFDQLAAVLVSDGESYGFYDAATGEMEAGPITPTLLWDLAKLDVGVAEAVGLLLAAPDPPLHGARAAVWLEDEDRLGVAFALSGVRRHDCPADPRRGWRDVACFAAPGDLAAGGDAFVFDRAGRLVELRSFEAAGVLRFRARFEDYRPIGEGAAAVEFPGRVTIESPAVRSQARFAWKRVMLAREVSDRLFRLPERNARDARGASEGSSGQGGPDDRVEQGERGDRW